MSVRVSTVATPSLDVYGYLADDGCVALAVDPPRDVDRVLALAGQLGVKITHVAETHVHESHVSGGLALARLTGAEYLVAADDEVCFDRLPVSDGDQVSVSDAMRVRVVSTPGHSLHHVSYLLDGPGGPVGVFTGGSLLFGSAGRVDLPGAGQVPAMAALQRRSAQRLAELLPDTARVWPGHGRGGRSVGSASSVTESTIGRERHVNPALRFDEDAFAETLAGLDVHPAFHADLIARNVEGAEPIDLTPTPRATARDVSAWLAAGAWVVDLRPRKAFAHRHLNGTLSLGLDGPMSTWLGRLAPLGMPISLLGDHERQVADAQRELARIGIERPAAVAVGDPDEWAGGDPHRIDELTTATFADLQAARDRGPLRGLPAPDVVLDVRTVDEWHTGHIAGATHIPLPRLPARLDEVPRGVVWVHCSSGYRAAFASSLLRRAGRQVVCVDDDVAVVPRSA